MLNAQIGRLETYPAVKMRMEQHLRETESQRAALARLLEPHGESASGLKDTMGKMMAAGQGLSGVFAVDEVMKGSLASYTFEHMEIASYRMLIAGAQELGLTDAVAVPEHDQRRETCRTPIPTCAPISGATANAMPGRSSASRSW